MKWRLSRMLLLLLLPPAQVVLRLYLMLQLLFLLLQSLVWSALHLRKLEGLLWANRLINVQLTRLKNGLLECLPLS
ncbi:hypothetical protein ANCCAN_20649 [Ancylostoma caninum]|uniref:Uncharacterized protein n=1 Tax=Ancylostoma caninum TaxID=29170 RepID=A0A368FPS1_ANCCA|nr:hypothetical protein ANCCAN_20649 [Ancylostoma caninum]